MLGYSLPLFCYRSNGLKVNIISKFTTQCNAELAILNLASYVNSIIILHVSSLLRLRLGVDSIQNDNRKVVTIVAISNVIITMQLE